MQNQDRLLGPNRAGLYITAIITIKTKELIKRILKDLLKNKVAFKIYKDIDSHNLFKKMDLGLLTF